MLIFSWILLDFSPQYYLKAIVSPSLWYIYKLKTFHIVYVFSVFLFNMERIKEEIFLPKAPKFPYYVFFNMVIQTDFCL